MPPTSTTQTRASQLPSSVGIKIRPRYLAWISLYLGLRLFGGGVGGLALIFLAIHALRGPRQVLQSLSLLVLSVNMNGQLFATPAGLSMLRWLVIGCSCYGGLRSIWGKKLPRVVSTQVTLLGFLALLSIATSFSPLISTMKLLSLGLGSVACLAAFQSRQLTRDEGVCWLYNLFAVFVFSSFPLMFTSLGYNDITTALGHEYGFVGLFNRPNELGMFLSMNLGWLIPKMMTVRYRSWLDIVLVASSLAFIYLSQSRGPIMVLAFSSTLFFLVATLSSPVWKARANQFLFNRMTMLGVMAIIIVLLFNREKVSEKAFAFLTKKEGNLVASISDRFVGVSIQIENFNEKPLTGIGFGIHSFPEQWIRSNRIGYDPVFHLPISAAVEKGSAAGALLEENGIIGFAAILVTWGSFVSFIMKRGDSLSLMLFLASMAINLSEFIMCSVGGLGLYMWLMVGLCLAPAVPAKASTSTSRNANLGRRRPQIRT